MCVSRSMRERWISGVGVAGGGVAGRDVRERGSEFGGLGWGGVGCCFIVVDGSVGAVRNGWSGRSVIVLTFGLSSTLFVGSVDVLELVGSGEGGSGWVGEKEGDVGVGGSGCSVGAGKS